MQNTMPETASSLLPRGKKIFLNHPGTGELYRKYRYPGGEEVKIPNPVYLIVTDNGHRVLGGNGVCYYQPYGWISLTWVTKDGDPGFFCDRTDTEKDTMLDGPSVDAPEVPTDLPACPALDDAEDRPVDKDRVPRVALFTGEGDDWVPMPGAEVLALQRGDQVCIHGPGDDPGAPLVVTIKDITIEPEGDDPIRIITEEGDDLQVPAANLS